MATVQTAQPSFQISNANTDIYSNYAPIQWDMDSTTYSTKNVSNYLPCYGDYAGISGSMTAYTTIVWDTTIVRDTTASVYTPGLREFMFEYPTPTINYTPLYISNAFTVTDSIFCAQNPATQKELKRAKLRSKLAVGYTQSRADFFKSSDPAEEVAVQTLREMVTEEEFKKYLRYGFVLVKGKSGKTYQVFRNRSHTKVWKDGKVVEEICVRIAYQVKVPPTDNVIAFKTMIAADEEAFAKSGNVYRFNESAPANGGYQIGPAAVGHFAGNAGTYAVAA